MITKLVWVVTMVIMTPPLLPITLKPSSENDTTVVLLFHGKGVDVAVLGFF